MFLGIILLMKFDVAVIGGGPAGLSASIFASRAGLKVICFEKLAIGGQAALSHDIANYPAFKTVSGFELTQKMLDQAKLNGTEIVFGDVQKVKKLKSGFSIKTKKETYQASKIIIACGTKARQLGLDEERYIGKGISYCASCDGGFFKNKNVAVVGGGDSAFVYAEYLARLANKVTLLNRSDTFKASKIRIENVARLKNVKVLTNAKLTSLEGDQTLTGINFKHNNVNKKLSIDGLFVAIGHIPNLDFLDFEIKLDKNGYIVVDKEMRTSEKNVFACGDIISKNFRQVITACADGAIAGNSCIGVANEK